MYTLSQLFLACFTCLISFTQSSPTIAARESHHNDTVRLLYQYPKGTWLENIAVRPSGELLITLLNKPQLDQLNPFEPNPTPSKVYNFPEALGLSGIGEIAPDSFAIAVGNFSFTTGGHKKSWKIWNVDFSAPHKTAADFKVLAELPGAMFLNGLCNIPSDKEPLDILVGDIQEGVINYVDTSTGSVNLAIKNDLIAVKKDPVFGSSGVDGIHVKDDILYFDTPSQHIFGSIPIHKDGTPAGKPHVIRKVHESEFLFYWDDFAIQGDDAYIVTGSGNSIERMGLDGTPKGQVIAGSLNSTQIAEPTSAAFGRTEADKHILYVVTAGGFATPVDGRIEVGAQVLAVDTTRWPC